MSSGLLAQGPNPRTQAWAGCELYDSIVTKATFKADHGNFDELYAGVTEVCDREPQIFEGNRAEISSVGIITGAAEREYHQAVADGLDAYITGEATEWVMHQAAEDGVHYLAAGHYATETFGVRALGQWVKRTFNIEVEYHDFPNPV